MTFQRHSRTRLSVVKNLIRALRSLPTILATCLVGLTPALAQEGMVFEHLTVKQGLSQGTVVCILQDHLGFMWLGTQDGLNKFDGYQVTVYKHDPADSLTLNDNFITLIAEDSNSTLWVGTLNSPQTLNRFDRKSETFTRIPREAVDLSRVRISYARNEYVDPAGARWSGVIGGGLIRSDPTTRLITSYRHDDAKPSSLIDDRVYSVVGDRSGFVWIGTREGLERFDSKTETFTHYRNDPKDASSLSDNWAWPILEARDGSLWVGTFRGGLNRLDRQTGKFTRFMHEDADSRSLAGDRLYSLYEDRSGMIWVGTGDQGVDRFHPQMNAFLHIHHLPSDPASLSDDNILSAFVDKGGNAWIGTRGGVDKRIGGTESFMHLRSNPTNPYSLSDNLVQCFVEDRAGLIWMGHLNGGLDRYDPRSGRVTHFRHEEGKSTGLTDNRIYALVEDRKGILWIGTYGGGLNRFDRKEEKFTAFIHNDSIPGSLGGAGVWALLEDHLGVLWVGTYGGGLDKFDEAQSTFTHFRHDDKDPASLSDDIVVCMHEDRTGTLWVGTTAGLNRMNRDTGTFQHFRERDGLANDMVFGILEDEGGNLWVSTNKGISRFDPHTSTFRNYSYSDGLQGDEFNQGAYARNPATGELFFGGGNGLTVFRPDRVRNNPYIPPVVFSGFERYNTDDREGKPIIEKGIDARDLITLSYKDNVANIKFSGLSYYNTSHNQYMYRLEGYGDSWIQLGTDRRATFTNLDGGSYLLQVKASNNDGVWNSEAASLRIVVTPPWWRTRWAYAMYGLITLGLLLGARRIELNRREQKTKVRESELRAKAAEAEKRALEAENERKTKELEDARRIQISMLPKEVPTIPGYEIAVSMKTATEVGGDYYDFLTGPDGSLNIAFGDATGHGMQAGTIVTLMKGLFLSDASRFDLQTFFNHCSRAIKEIRLGRLFMAFSLVRLKEKSLSFASAGMPPAYLYRKRDNTVEELFLKGMPLGAMKTFPYAVHETLLEDGDTVLLLTDGLPEGKNRNEEMFEYQRVESAFISKAQASPADIVSHLMNEGERWSDGAALDDDVTILVIKRVPGI